MVNAYVGQQGEAYHAQRAGSRSDRTQSLRARVFQDIASEQVSILDFGCGTGGILNQLRAKERLAVEVNETAAEEARRSGIQVFPAIEDIPDGRVDVAISHHALEHVPSPGHILSHLLRVLRPGGRARIVVPAESPFWSYQGRWSDDNDRHLFSWTPRTLGHLMRESGFEVTDARVEAPNSDSRLLRLAGLVPGLRPVAHRAQAQMRQNLNVVVDARRPS